MKQILTHMSRSVPDVIEILLRGGTFTCPRLPHYRYEGTKRSRNILMKAGMLRQTGVSETGVNYVASDLFKEWQKEYEVGITKLQLVKWAKERKKNVEIIQHDATG